MEKNASNPESREALLESLVLRLSSHPFDPRPYNPQLFVGQLPEHLPFEVPVPEGSRIIGSLARGSEHLDILLDVPLPPEQARAFYKERLLATGWTDLGQSPHLPRHGGFVHSPPAALRHDATFCKGPEGPSLHFSVRGEQGGFTDVRLDLNRDERESPCAQDARMRRQQRLYEQRFGGLIPTLAPPEGAQQMSGSSSSGSDSSHASATLETDSDPAALAAHYAGQLAQAGWTQTDAGRDGPLAWHTWTFKDEDGEDWRGTFFLLKMPGLEKTYFLSIRVDIVHKRQRRGGFSSTRIGV